MVQLGLQSIQKSLRGCLGRIKGIYYILITHVVWRL